MACSPDVVYHPSWASLNGLQRLLLIGGETCTPISQTVQSYSKVRLSSCYSLYESWYWPLWPKDPWLSEMKQQKTWCSIMAEVPFFYELFQAIPNLLQSLGDVLSWDSVFGLGIWVQLITMMFSYFLEDSATTFDFLRVCSLTRKLLSPWLFRYNIDHGFTII